MKNQLEIIKGFKGKKEYCVWDMEKLQFFEVSRETFFALAIFSTCGTFAWQIDIRPSLSGILHCYLEPNFSVRAKGF